MFCFNSLCIAKVTKSSRVTEEARYILRYIGLPGTIVVPAQEESQTLTEMSSLRFSSYVPGNPSFHGGIITHVELSFMFLCKLSFEVVSAF